MRARLSTQSSPLQRFLLPSHGRVRRLALSLQLGSVAGLCLFGCSDGKQAIEVSPSGGGTVSTTTTGTGGGAPSTSNTGGISATGGFAGASTAGTGGSVANSFSLTLEETESGFCGVDGLIEAIHAGFTGVGYANTNNAIGAAVRYSLSSPSETPTSLTIRYASGSETRSANLSVNGSVVTQVEFPGTTSFADYEELKVELRLPSGKTTVELSASSALGLPNIDSLSWTSPVLLSAGTCTTIGPDPKMPVTLWLAGDSTVANGQAPCPVGWGKSFADYFNDAVTVVNSAAGGRSVRTWLYDVSATKGADGECVLNKDGSGAPIVQARWTSMLAGMKSGDYLFIQFGINDGDATCPRHVGAAQLRTEYTMMAQAALDRGAHPILLTPVSAISCSGSTAVGSRGFLADVKAVGENLGIPVIDLHSLSVELYNQSGFCPVPGGDVSASTTGPVGEFFCDDHTHFSSSGATSIAELVANAIVNQGLELKVYRL